MAYRRLYQGILIQFGRNRQVGTATVARFCTLLSMFALLVCFTSLPGAVVGAAALTCSFTMEALIVRVMARGLVTELEHTPAKGEDAALSYRSISVFYIPLGLTTLIFCAAQPILTFYMARAPRPIESLAALPIINNFVWVSGCLVFAMQEVVISRLGRSHQQLASLRQFLLLLTGIVVSLLALVLFTPLADFTFFRLYGLSPELGELVLGDAPAANVG